MPNPNLLNCIRVYNDRVNSFIEFKTLQVAKLHSWSGSRINQKGNLVEGILLMVVTFNGPINVSNVTFRFNYAVKADPILENLARGWHTKFLV